MANKLKKNLSELVNEAKTFHEILDVLVADRKRVVGIYRDLVKQRHKVAISNRQQHLDLMKYNETQLKQLEARRKRYEQHQSDKKIPAKLRKEIAQTECDLLRAENTTSYGFGNYAIRGSKERLSLLFEQVDQIKNPPKPLSTTNKAFKVGKDFPSVSITRAYDGHIWDVLKGHFQMLPRAKGQRTSFNIVAALPEKEEYLQLKERHFTRTLETLIDEAFEIVEELTEELQEAYDNMPEGLQGGEVGEARLEAVSQLESISDDAPNLPDSVSALQLVHLPSLKQSSRRDRAYDAAAKLKTASQGIQKHVSSGIKLKKADAKALDDCCGKLESLADEIKAIEFPGMFG